MIFTLAFLVAILAVAGWWLLRHGIAAKPWLETVPAAGVPDTPVAPAVMGLRVFIAVAASLLVLLVSAYAMRMEMADWQPPPQPRLLWANTGVLLLSSAALHYARSAVRRGNIGGVRDGLVVGSAAAVIFLAGQVLAWRELAAAGYTPTSNPADAFFYLITAAHGLHVLGGLVALARTGTRLWRGDEMERLRLSVELCTTYWHFLLIAWIALFSMLAFSPSFTWLYAICAAPFR
ncbi:cytochrome c oxidase subunit 3 [Humitalea sp. 24SJ18S-53]|uniref:cytochrome c oxidase subunit 3 n=1 Tax=Humitalea sp. 24SJ18S-53 TaxID=3422307 RepID=UPI003D674A72